MHSVIVEGSNKLHKLKNMKIDKEYPATHSMSTAWYCVDEEGNVGIVDIHDNGPIPNEDECE